MTHKHGKIVIGQQTGHAECSQCKKIKELRPYGKNGAWICFQCGMLDEDEAKRQCGKLFSGERDI